MSSRGRSRYYSTKFRVYASKVLVNKRIPCAVGIRFSGERRAVVCGGGRSEAGCQPAARTGDGVVDVNLPGGTPLPRYTRKEQCHYRGFLCTSGTNHNIIIMKLAPRPRSSCLPKTSQGAIAQGGGGSTGVFHDAEHALRMLAREAQQQCPHVRLPSTRPTLQAACTDGVRRHQRRGKCNDRVMESAPVDAWARI